MPERIISVKAYRCDDHLRLTCEDFGERTVVLARTLDQRSILDRLPLDAERADILRQYTKGLPPGEELSAITALIRAAPTASAAREAAQSYLQVARVDLERRWDEATAKRRQAEAHLAALEDVMEWWNGPLILGGVTDSALHRALTEHLPIRGEPGVMEGPAPRSDYTVFLVQHDWAGLIANADVDDGEYRLPSDAACFEMTVTGRRICALVESEGGAPQNLAIIISSRGGWFCGVMGRIGEGKRSPLADLVLAQIRAVAIMLDAEVVMTTQVRAPAALNAQRIKHNRMPVFDHHTISLARRTRAEPLRCEPGASGRRHRLHFRRGHWRHYPTHKTWIRWCLAGDPSLGFADKDYRL